MSGFYRLFDYLVLIHLTFITSFFLNLKISVLLPTCQLVILFYNNIVEI